MYPNDAAEIDFDADSTGRFIPLNPMLGGWPIHENPVTPEGVAVFADWSRASIFTDGVVELSVMDGTAHYNAGGVFDGTLWEHNEIRIGDLAISRSSSFAFVLLNADATVPTSAP